MRLKRKQIEPGILLLLTLLPFWSAAQGLNFKRETGGVHIQEDGMDVLFYQTTPTDLDGAYRRANYIHPLYGLDGGILTEDFPADHPHHRGIFWAWHQVLAGGRQLGDAWECRDFIWDVREVNLQTSDSVLVLNSKVHWKSPDFKDQTGKLQPFLEEINHIRVYPRTPNFRIIDFTIALRALIPDLSLGGSDDEKGYGGFSVRLKMPEDLQFSSQQGPVIPTETAVRAGTWMNISGSLGKNGALGGLVIASKNNFNQDGACWILRKNGSMQNAVFPGRDPLPVSEKNPLVLRYRLLLYKGELSTARILDLLSI